MKQAPEGARSPARAKSPQPSRGPGAWRRATDPTLMASFLLAATMIASMVSAGGAARVRYFDAYYRDCHRWDAREDRVYRRYWDEHHERYRGWKELQRARTARLLEMAARSSRPRRKLTARRFEKCPHALAAPETASWRRRTTRCWPSTAMVSKSGGATA